MTNHFVRWRAGAGVIASAALIISGCANSNSAENPANNDVIRAASIEDCLKPKAVCVAPDFTGMDLSGLDFRGASLAGAKFDGANLAGADFSGANLASASMTPIECDAPMGVSCTQAWDRPTLSPGVEVRSHPPFGSAAGFAGDGQRARGGDLKFSGPQGLAFSADSRIMYVADSKNRRIRSIDLVSGIVSTVAGNGTKCVYDIWRCGDSGDPGSAARATLAEPSGLVLDGTRNRLLIADAQAHVIRAVNLADSSITTVAGNGKAGFPKDDSAATLSPLAGPAGMAVAGKWLYVADRLNNAVFGIDLELNTVKRLVGDTQGRSCPVNGLNGKAKEGPDPCTIDGPARNAKLANPRDVAISPSGELYIADTDDFAVRKVVPAAGNLFTGTISSVIHDQTLVKPSFVEFDNQGNLFVGPVDSIGKLLGRVLPDRLNKGILTWSDVPRIAADSSIGPGGIGAIGPSGRFVATVNPRLNTVTLSAGRVGPNLQGASFKDANLGDEKVDTSRERTRFELVIQHPDTDFSGANLANASIKDSVFINFDRVCMQGLLLAGGTYDNWTVNNSDLTNLVPAPNGGTVIFSKPKITHSSFSDTQPKGRWIVKDGTLNDVSFNSFRGDQGQFRIEGGTTKNVPMVNTTTPDYSVLPVGWLENRVCDPFEPVSRDQETRVILPDEKQQVLIGSPSTYTTATWSGVLELVTDGKGRVSAGNIKWKVKVDASAWVTTQLDYQIRLLDSAAFITAGNIPIPNLSGSLSHEGTHDLTGEIRSRPQPLIREQSFTVQWGGRRVKSQFPAGDSLASIGWKATGQAKGIDLLWEGRGTTSPWSKSGNVIANIQANNSGKVEEVNFTANGSPQPGFWPAPANNDKMQVVISDPSSGLKMTGPVTGKWDIGEFNKVFGWVKSGQRFTATIIDKNNGSTIGSFLLAIHNEQVPSDPVPSIGPAEAKGDGSYSAVVSWDKPLEEGVGPITGYKLSSDPKGFGCSTSSTETSCRVNGLMAGTPYKFDVAAINKWGTGPISDPVTLKLGPPSSPQGVKVSAPSGQSLARNKGSGKCLTLGSFGGDGYAPIKQEDCADSAQQVVIQSDKKLMIDSSCIETRYLSQGAPIVAERCRDTGQQVWRLEPDGSILNPYGEGDPYAPQTIRRCIDVPGGSTNSGVQLQLWGCNGSDAQIWTFESSSGTSAVVSWNPPADDGHFPVTSYKVVSEPGAKTCTAVAPKTSCTVTGISSATEYQFKVTAVNAIGESEPASGTRPGI